MYSFGSTFLKKEDYGEIENDLSKADQPYAKVLRITKAKMMMEDGWVWALPDQHYYARNIGGGTGIYTDEIQKTGSYKLSDKEIIEELREQNARVTSLEYKQEVLASLILVTEQSKQRDEQKEKEIRQKKLERSFAIYVQNKFHIENRIFKNIYGLLFFYRESIMTLIPSLSA